VRSTQYRLTYVCMYVYIYICIPIYIHHTDIYIYIYIEREREVEFGRIPCARGGGRPGCAGLERRFAPPRAPRPYMLNMRSEA